MKNMRKYFYLMAAAIMALGFTACTDTYDNPVPQPETNPDDQTGYTVKMVPVNRDGNDAGTVAIRFYEDMPSVPYISVADFQNIMVPGTTVSVTKTGTGIYELKNAGATLTVNTVAETCVFDDFLNFTNQMGLVQEGIENVCYDGLPFVRFNHQTLIGGRSTSPSPRWPTSMPTSMATMWPATARRWSMPATTVLTMASVPWMKTSRRRIS